MANEVNIPSKARALGAEELNELRDLMEELGAIPLSALPPEVWPLVYEHQQKITAPEFDPPSLEVRFYDNLNERLRERKKLREQQEQSELIPFNF